jgi:transposase
MQVTDFARKVPEDVWTLFAPLLPPVVWCGNGCRPYDKRECRHAVLYVLGTGSGWRRLPPGFPSSKTVQRRLTVWLELDACRTAWRHLAQRSEALQGINWEEVLLDGAKQPAKKGANGQGRAPWIAANVGRRCI